MPDDALDRLPEELVPTVKDRADLERVANKLVSESQDLTIRRRIVLFLRARIEARGALSPKEFEDLLSRARSVGWQTADVERLIEDAKAAFPPPKPPSTELKLKDEPRRPPSDPPPEAPRRTAPPVQPPKPEAEPSGAPARPVPRTALLATVGIVAVLAVIAALTLTGGGEGPGADRPEDGGSNGSVADAQRLLARLGEPVPVTGVYDAATQAALGRALPEYAGMETLEPWLVERLAAALDEADAAAWAAAEQGGTSAGITDYLERFPDGAFANRARERLTELEASTERSDILRSIQQELDRLGRDVEETGELDQQTLEAFDGFPGPLPNQTRSSLRTALEALQTMRRWPVPNGGTFRDCLVCPEMVAIPAGVFTMGSPDNERMRSANEGPQRVVNVPRFAMSRTEITYGEWLPCVAEGVCRSVPEPQGENWLEKPVTHIGWDDVLAYTRWLRERTGFVYRLPSEAQWEYAARAGTTTRYSTGDCISDQQANFDARLASGDCPAGSQSDGLLPVARFAPNDFGLYDMHGNALEPTSDCWNGSYEGAPTDGSAWDTGDCSRAPYRGGSWTSSDRQLRSAARVRPSGTQNNEVIGLRLVTELFE